MIQSDAIVNVYYVDKFMYLVLLICKLFLYKILQNNRFCTIFFWKEIIFDKYKKY